MKRKKSVLILIIIALILIVLFTGCKGTKSKLPDSDNPSGGSEDEIPLEFVINNSAEMRELRILVDEALSHNEYYYEAVEPDVITKIWKKDSRARLEFTYDNTTYIAILDHDKKLSFDIDMENETAFPQIYDTETIGPDLTLILYETKMTLDRVSAEDNVVKSIEIIDGIEATRYIIAYYDDMSGYTEISYWFNTDQKILIQSDTRVSTMTDSYTVKYTNYSFDPVDEDIVTLPEIEPVG